MPRADQQRPDPSLGSQPETKPFSTDPASSIQSTDGHAQNNRSTANTGPNPNDAGEAMPEIPGFEFKRRLGGGGMGIVYEVIKLDTHFALKVIRPDRADDEFRARFRKEASALLKIDHPHIARIFEYNEVKGTHYFTMRLLTGGTLSERMAKFAGDPTKVVDLLATIADAVGYLHRRGILHRDLKPGNVLFDEFGKPYIADFGLVKGISDRDANAPISDSVDPSPTSLAGDTTVGKVLGTPRYMSPEQRAGRVESVSERSDVWALGVILYELLTGARPDEEALKGEKPLSIRSVNPTFDESLDRIVQICVAQAPLQRYPTANELASALRNWHGEQEGKRRRRRLIMGLASAACVLLLAIAVAVTTYRHFNDPERPVHEAQRRLKDGQPVQLIPEKGLALFAKARTGDEASIRLEKDGTMTVMTQKLALIELLPDPMIERYRFKVQMRQNTTTARSSRSGIYCLHSAHKKPNDVLHSFAELSVCDNDEGERDLWEFKGPAEDRHITSVTFMMRVGGEESPPYSKNSPGGQTAYETDELKGQPGPWHELEFEVTPQQVVAKHQGKQVGLAKNETLNRRLNSLLQGPGNFALLPLASPRGGLGLYSMGSTASYRLGAIEPLP